MNGEKHKILKLETEKRLFKSKSIDEIYNTLSDDIKDVDFDLVTLFETFKALINYIIIIQKLFKHGYEQRNEGRTADEVLLDFHDKPTEFNKKFMKFYVDIL